MAEPVDAAARAQGNTLTVVYRTNNNGLRDRHITVVVDPEVGGVKIRFRTNEAVNGELYDQTSELLPKAVVGDLTLKSAKVDSKNVKATFTSTLKQIGDVTGYSF